MNDAVLFDARKDGIAIVTINRPEHGSDLSPIRLCEWQY